MLTASFETAHSISLKAAYLVWDMRRFLFHRVCPLGYANAKEDAADATHLQRGISLREIISCLNGREYVSDKLC